MGVGIGKGGLNNAVGKPLRKIPPLDDEFAVIWLWPTALCETGKGEGHTSMHMSARRWVGATKSSIITEEPGDRTPATVGISPLRTSRDQGNGDPPMHYLCRMRRR